MPEQNEYRWYEYMEDAELERCVEESRKDYYNEFLSYINDYRDEDIFFE